MVFKYGKIIRNTFFLYQAAMRQGRWAQKLLSGHKLHLAANTCLWELILRRTLWSQTIGAQTKGLLYTHICVCVCVSVCACVYV